MKKLSPDAVIPGYAKPGDAGLDLTAVTLEISRDVYTYSTELAVEIPEGYVGLVFPRSSVYKTGLSLCNSVGMIDSGYRGPIIVKFRKSGDVNPYKTGERVAQLFVVPFPRVLTVEVDALSGSERGEGGFGSTG